MNLGLRHFRLRKIPGTGAREIMVHHSLVCQLATMLYFRAVQLIPSRVDVVYMQVGHNHDLKTPP